MGMFGSWQLVSDQHSLWRSVKLFSFKRPLLQERWDAAGSPSVVQNYLEMVMAHQYLGQYLVK